MPNVNAGFPRKSAQLAPEQLRLYGRITLSTEFGELLTESRIRLLEAIECTGSLSSASRMLPMSYKAAWDAVEQMNRLAGHALVERTVGGRQGGGTTLTEHGRRFIVLYRSVETQCRNSLSDLLAELRPGGYL